MRIKGFVRTFRGLRASGQLILGRKHPAPVITDANALTQGSSCCTGPKPLRSRATAPGDEAGAPQWATPASCVQC